LAVDTLHVAPAGTKGSSGRTTCKNHLHRLPTRRHGRDNAVVLGLRDRPAGSVSDEPAEVFSALKTYPRPVMGCVDQLLDSVQPADRSDTLDPPQPD
jgi:hypothetical protein